MSAEYMSFVIPIEAEEAEELVEKLEPLEDRTQGQAILTSPADLLEAMQDVAGAEVCRSATFPSIAALDRFVAAPAGRSLLGGRAFVLIPADQVKSVRGRIQALLIRNGGPEGAAGMFAEILDRWGNGSRDAMAAIDGIEGGLRAALDGKTGVLIAVSVA